jgi:hypothetical protein
MDARNAAPMPLRMKSLPTPVRRVFAAAAILVATLGAAGGCGKRGDSTPPAGNTESAAQRVKTTSGAESSPELLGIWTVVGHHVPGVSAMTDADAKARHGSTVRLTATETLSPGNHCDQPAYSTRTVARDRFLAEEFRLPPGALVPLASQEQISLLEVSCNGQRWSGMGALLVKIDADHALAPFDGVFFELARDHDFRAIGQEPGWQLQIHKGKDVQFTYAYGEHRAVTPAPTPTTDPSSVQTYHAITEANDLRIVIEPKPCADSMSGQPFPATVTVTLNGETYRGCGGPTE